VLETFYKRNLQKGATFGLAMALLANIILGWEGLPRTNTLTCSLCNENFYDRNLQKGTTFGLAMALLANIILGWEGLSRTNTIASEPLIEVEGSVQCR
jgi:multisubunit Na+/H+ antiporter MnhG subunit